MFFIEKLNTLIDFYKNATSFSEYILLGIVLIGGCIYGWFNQLSVYIGRSGSCIIFALVGLCIFLVYLGITYFIKKFFNTKSRKENEQPNPELHLTVSGANIFIPNERPELTGIAVNARIWNTGAPSIVTNWSMKIIPNGETPVVAQLTAVPNVLRVTGISISTNILASDSLETKTNNTHVGITPIFGVLLFYVALPKNIVQANNTCWEITAKDINEKETKIVQLVGNWLHG